ncbi:hypothetical protein JCM39068_16280 [Desulfocastanea catecholica]
MFFSSLQAGTTRDTSGPAEALPISMSPSRCIFFIPLARVTEEIIMEQQAMSDTINKIDMRSTSLIFFQTVIRSIPADSHKNFAAKKLAIINRGGK